LPKAVRVDFGKCAIVRFLFAAAAAFLMFLRAALLCFSLAMFFSWFAPEAIHDGMRQNYEAHRQTDQP
jgi:hypothetical protein